MLKFNEQMIMIFLTRSDNLQPLIKVVKEDSYTKERLYTKVLEA